MKNNLRRYLEAFPLVVISVPLFFCLHTFNYYFGLTNLSNHFPGILVYLLAPAFALVFLRLLVKSYTKAAILLLFLMLFFYPFQYLHGSLKQFVPLLSRYSILLPTILILTCLLILYLARSESSVSRFLFATNTIFLILVLVELVGLITKSFGHAERKNFLVEGNVNLHKQNSACDTCGSPDIYFLLFDEYADSQTLTDEFSFDNSWFDESLKSRGFRIIGQSTSNYNITPISMASILNMNYLKNLSNEKVELKRFLQGNYTVEQNALTRMLKEKGYEINNYSLFDLGSVPTKIVPFVSRFNDEILLGETFFYKARRDIWWTIKIFFKDSALSRKSLDLMEEDILRMKQAFEGAVYEARKIKSAPQFTYCHFLNAHGPWYFDSSGKRLDPMRTSLAGANRDDYINNIIYANKSFIIPVVDSIKKNAKRPYVIILQGDHGYTEYPKHKKNLVFRNLNAWYFSDRDYSGLYESLSSVNTFRVILNKYFGANIPLLKDSSIYLDKLTTGK